MADGYKCILVSPNGKEIFGKNNEYIDVRKNLMEQCNLTKIVYLPSQSFKPYTGVETLILFFTKGEQTKETEFYNLIKNKDDTCTEQLIKKLSIDDIKNKQYSWNVKDYQEIEVKQFDGVEYKKLGDVCEFPKGTKRRIGEAHETGKYPFFTCSIYDHKFSDVYDYEEGIIINAINGAGKCEVFYGKNYSLTIHNIHWKSIDVNKISNKFIYYYFKNNIRTLEFLMKGNNQKIITQYDVSNLVIPVPPIEIQQMIINELDDLYEIKENAIKMLKKWSVNKKIKFENLLSECKDVKYISLEHLLLKSKKTVAIDDDVEYKQLTVKLHFKGLEERCRKRGCEIGIKKQFLTETNDFIVSKINFQNGACGVISDAFSGYIVTNDFPLFKINTNHIRIEYFEKYINLGIISRIMKLRENGATIKRINTDDFKLVKIPLPTKSDQDKIIKEITKCEELEENLKTTINEIDINVKKRFEYYLGQCNNFIENNNEENLNNDLNEKQDADFEPEEEKSRDVKKNKLINKKKTILVKGKNSNSQNK